MDISDDDESSSPSGVITPYPEIIEENINVGDQIFTELLELKHYEDGYQVIFAIYSSLISLIVILVVLSGTGRGE